MSKELREYHYEFVEGRARPWRVADYEDDVVTDFATEAEALAYVENHNHMPKEQEKRGVFSPEAQAAADAFFTHKKEHPAPVPYEHLTPLQKRMQSGGV